MRALALIWFILSLVAGAVSAQDAPRTILVLDASNSMWGQIGGEAKITIAQRVMRDLLQSLPAEQELGLTLYGHRREGDCADIETLVPPGPGTRDAIAAAVDAIKPKGKTPMTDAIIAAAEALGYQDNPATVILVSDGIETCHPDPCAAADALEAAGAAFTAHVIGFDISDPEAIGQMQCLAERTGGRFLAAKDAGELASALTEVAAAPPPPEPEPVAQTVTFEATLGEAGPVIGGGLVWYVNTDPASDPTGTFSAELLRGDSYVAYVTRPEDGASADKAFSVGDGPLTVTLVLPEIARAATLEAPVTAAIGATIPVGWTAETGEADYISIAEPGQAAAEYRAYAYIRDGNPAPLRLPLVPGGYELRYVFSSGGLPDQVIASQNITLTDLAVSLDADAAGAAGSELAVSWTGPGYAGDYVAVAPPDAPDNEYAAYRYTDQGKPAPVTLPNVAGRYELRYVAAGFPDRVLARRPVEVVATSASLSAPDQTVQGNELPVTWAGPDGQGDYLAAARPGAPAAEYLSYVYTERGNPGLLKMPLDPGTYELRYVAEGAPPKVLATRPIEIVAAEMALAAPANAPIGSEIAVDWTGPGNPGDYLSVARTGASDNEYATYAYTDRGNPAALALPAEPGDWEIRYVGSGYPEKVLARLPIRLDPVTARLTVPAVIAPGAEFDVGWTGPGYRGDFIAIGLPGDRAYTSYAYTERGNPARILAPAAPGNYELRYQLGQGETVIATVPVTVE